MPGSHPGEQTPSRQALTLPGPAYSLDVATVEAALRTSPDGLSSDEARARLAAFGENRVATVSARPWWLLALHQFQDPLIYILLMAGVVMVLLGQEVDAAVIFGVVLLNGSIGFYQELRAERAVLSLLALTAPRARVIRDGFEEEVDAATLVPGDVVLLASGDKVPADLRLTHATGLQVDESLLTGESLPASKTTRPLDARPLIPGDQRNMAFLGTVVTRGRGRGVVVHTGLSTELGRISKEVHERAVTTTPLQERMAALGRLIGLAILLVGVLVVAIGLVRGESAVSLFLTAVAMAVATIPEGLPVVLTITLAVGVGRMARRNAILRRLAAVETLGSCTLIGSDKTGTLTANEMTVVAVETPEGRYRVTGTGYAPVGTLVPMEGAPPVDGSEALRVLLRAVVLCNESHLILRDGTWRIQGDPTEAALLVLARKAGLDEAAERERWTELDALPFESDVAYMATLDRSPEGERVVFVKGAPEKVLQLCGGEGAGEGAEGTVAGGAAGSGPAEASHRRAALLQRADEMAAAGLRVLAVAVAPWNRDEVTHDALRGRLRYAGMVAMEDPPRPEAAEAVRRCREAGIRVVMITGDHARTALAVARRMGLVRENDLVVTGEELARSSPSDLRRLIREVPVFARVAPGDKLRLVEAARANGEVVAVTGDGVNDAPALRAAHIGVAMGRSGTDVAREAADMILADDNFASLFAAVEEGRVVYDNIRKVVFFLLPTGAATALSLLATLVAGLPLPFVPVQALWINLVTNGLQDVALAYEPAEPGVASRPPRPPGEPVLNRLMVQRLLLVGGVGAAAMVAHFGYQLAQGAPVAYARTAAVTTMVLYQFFHVWNARSERRSILEVPLLGNPFLFAAVAAAVVAQVAAVSLPALRFVFHFTPLAATTWLECLVLAFPVVLVVEADKGVRAAWQGRRRGTRPLRHRPERFSRKRGGEEAGA